MLSITGRGDSPFSPTLRQSILLCTRALNSTQAIQLGNPSKVVAFVNLRGHGTKNREFRVVLRHLDIHPLSQEEILKLSNGDGPTMEAVLLEVKQKIEITLREGRYRPCGGRRSRSSSRGLFEFGSSNVALLTCQGTT